MDAKAVAMAAVTAAAKATTSVSPERGVQRRRKSVSGWAEGDDGAP
jgi:hypothetical protein